MTALTQAIETLAANTAVFLRDREEILDNRDASQTFKQDRLEKLEARSWPLAEKAAIKIWGGIITNPNGTFTLDGDNGLIWTTGASLDQRLSAEKTRALRADIDPAWLEIAEKRAHGLIKTCQNPDELLAIFMRGDSDTQRCLEFFGMSLLASHPGLDWDRLRRHLNAAYMARMNSPLAERIQGEIDDLNLVQFPAALRATKEAANELGRFSAYLASVLNGVSKFQESVTLPGEGPGVFISYQIVSWGVATSQRGKTTRREVIKPGNQGEQWGLFSK